MPDHQQGPSILRFLGLWKQRLGLGTELRGPDGKRGDPESRALRSISTMGTTGLGLRWLLSYFANWSLRKFWIIL